jgi:outer membrane receptor protein involved in Fe transport
MRYRLFAIVLILYLILCGAKGQGIIKGRVIDNNSHELLPGVYVIYGKTLGTSTDQNGNWLIKTDSARLVITFKLVGYKTFSKQVHLRSGETLELNIGLETETQAIDQVVVSADRIEQKVAELTVSLDIIKSDFLSQSHIIDPQELINKVPGIEVIDGQTSIRGGSGFSYGVGSRVLALVDGLPLLSPDAGNIKWQFLPLENLSQIEIIKGASSVLYGSSALNGIINFRTAEATNTSQSQLLLETGIYGKPENRNWKWWSSPRLFSNISFSHLQKSGKTDIGIGINLLSDMGYRKYNDEKLGRISLRLKHHNARIDGLNYGLNINAGYTTRRDFILWENAETGALKQDTSTVSLYNGSFYAFDPFITYGKTQRFKHEFRARILSMNNKFPVRIQNNTNAFSVYGEYQVWYRLFDFMGVTAGLSENWNKVTSNFFGDHDGINISGFAQLELKPVNRLKFVSGVRIEQNSLDSEKDNIVPIFRAGLNFQAADYTFIRASFGQGSRYPSIAEKFAATTLGSVRIFPNQYVQSETGWSSEIGIKQGIQFAGMTGQADLSFFLSQNKDLIEYIFGLYPDPETGIFGVGFRAANIEQSRVYGTELELLLSRSFGDLSTSINGGYTFIYPVEFNSLTNKNSDIYLKYRRKHSGKLGIGTTWKKFDLGINLFIRSKILNIDDVFVNPVSREKILPGFYDYWIGHNTGYFLMDVNLGYRLSKILRLSFAIKNITNTEYMGRPGDIQVQRNFSLRLTGNF